MKIKVGINGFGRIGRNVLRIVEEMPRDNFEVVAVNARADAKTLAHLFKYDSCYGIFKGEVKVKDENTITINNNEIKILRYGDPSEIPWKDLGVDIVVESTGKFVKREEVPAERVEKEMEILKIQTMNEGKPEAIAEKIVQGRIGKFYEEICLVDQAFVKEPSKKVSQLLSEKYAEVVAFARFEKGEGIEKKEENFAEEVMKQLQ